MDKLIAVSNNGLRVFLNYDDTHVTFHIQETPDLLDLVKEAIESTDISGEEMVFEKDMGRIVGTTSLVETKIDDDVVYAKRKERNEYSRFVRGKDLISTSYIVVCVRKKGDLYMLWTAWCGRLLPKEWYDSSSHFSQTHALVYDESLIQLDTITKYRP